MRNIFFIVLFFVLYSCDDHRFDKDKRQIMAKDEIRYKLRRARSFDITGFKEDTLTVYPDSLFKRPIRYTLDFVYQDSNKVLQKKKGVVIFTPDGRSIISSNIDSTQ
jgi:hypothetical protein